MLDMKMEKAAFLRLISIMHKKRRLCFILGAGASKDCGIPTAKELTRQWFGELLQGADISDEWKKILSAEEDARERVIAELQKNLELLDAVLHRSEWDITKCLKLEDFIRIKVVMGVTESYSELFAYCYPDAELRNEVVEEFIRNAQITAGYKALANILINGKHNLVITTNFDTLIERAINENNPAINVRKMYHAGDDQCDAFRENNFSDSFLASNPPLIIKAHSEITRQILKNTPEELRYLPDSFYNKLQTIFSMYTPVFIGYAGTDAAFVYMLLRYARSNARKECGCFWLIYGKENDKPEDLVSKQIIEYVKLVNGKFVMHDGFETIMPEIANRILQGMNMTRGNSLSNKNTERNPPIVSEDSKVLQKMVVKTEGVKTEDLEHMVLRTCRKGNYQ